MHNGPHLGRQVLLKNLCASVKKEWEDRDSNRPRYPKLHPRRRLLLHSRDSPVSLFNALAKPFTIYKTHRSNQWVDQILMIWPGTWTRMIRAGRQTRCCDRLKLFCNAITHSRAVRWVTKLTNLWWFEQGLELNWWEQAGRQTDRQRRRDWNTVGAWNVKMMVICNAAWKCEGVLWCNEGRGMCGWGGYKLIRVMREPKRRGEYGDESAELLLREGGRGWGWWRGKGRRE